MREKKMSLIQIELLKCVWLPLVLHIALLSGPTHSLNIYNHHNLCRTQGTQSTKRNEEVVTEILMDPHPLLPSVVRMGASTAPGGKICSVDTIWSLENVSKLLSASTLQLREVHPSCPHQAWTSAEGRLMHISPGGSVSPLSSVAFPSCQWAHSSLL